MLKPSTRRLKLAAILWVIFITVLFVLPGSAFPKENWLDKIFFDKWIHLVFFTILLFLWRFYFSAVPKYNWIAILLAFIYGMSVEAVQHYFVPNRSFDVGDLLADMLGAVAGIMLWNRRYIKK